MLLSPKREISETLKDPDGLSPEIWQDGPLWPVAAISCFGGSARSRLAGMADSKPKAVVALLKYFNILFLKWDGFASKATHTI